MYPDRPDAELLIHLCGAGEWDDAQRVGAVRPASLGVAGFVHLSAPWQVQLPANRLFAGRTDLTALFVDPSALDAPLIWEPGVPDDPESMLFPHLYGRLPVAAVVEVRPYRPGPDGLFSPLTRGPFR